MVNQTKTRFEELIHEKNDLESPRTLRRRHLIAILVKNLEEEFERHEYNDYDSEDYSFDNDVYKAIFEDPEGEKFY